MHHQWGSFGNAQESGTNSSGLLLSRRVTDLQCVRAEMKLFIHAETNTAKCDIYPQQSFCL